MIFLDYQAHLGLQLDKTPVVTSENDGNNVV